MLGSYRACALLITLAAVGFSSCERSGHHSADVTVKFSADGKRWELESGDKTLVFTDEDLDGLATGCDVFRGEELLRHVGFPNRLYLKGLTLGDVCLMAPVPAAGDIVGIDIVIPPRPPLLPATMRSERVADTKLVSHIVGLLYHYSYVWDPISASKMKWLKEPSGTGEEMGVSFGNGSIYRGCPAWIGMEIWFKNDPAPLMVMAHHLDNSYETHSEGMKAERNGLTLWFANDALAELFATLSLGQPKQRLDNILPDPGSGQKQTLGVYERPTFWGGIPVNWDGKPFAQVSIAEKLMQVRTFLTLYGEELLLVDSGK